MIKEQFFFNFQTYSRRWSGIYFIDKVFGAFLVLPAPPMHITSKVSWIYLTMQENIRNIFGIKPTKLPDINTLSIALHLKRVLSINCSLLRKAQLDRLG